MTRRLLAPICGVLACLAVFGPQKAHAQFPYSRPGASSYVRPPISPYLNLLRGGNPAVNYYGVVRPEQQFYNSFQQLGQQVAANQMQLAEADAQSAQEFTGHMSYFMNLSHYYPGHIGQRSQGGVGGAHTNPRSANTARPPTGGTGGGSLGASVPRR